MSAYYSTLNTALSGLTWPGNNVQSPTPIIPAPHGPQNLPTHTHTQPSRSRRRSKFRNNTAQGHFVAGAKLFFWKATVYVHGKDKELAMKNIRIFPQRTKEAVGLSNHIRYTSGPTPHGVYRPDNASGVGMHGGLMFAFIATVYKCGNGRWIIRNIRIGGAL